MDIKRRIAGILPGIIEFRHQLHRMPEIAGMEFETMALIRRELNRIGIEPEKPFLGTDTVALIHGRGPGANVTLRADIDALAVNEETALSYASQNPGMMHACGHDGHTAMVMGAAEILNGLRDQFSGSIRFVWQPGEENRALGRDLVGAGALQNPKADFVTALHGMPGLPLGVLGVRNGAIMGSCAHFKVIIHGCGGHSSRPHLARDPVVAAAAVITELQSVVSRRINPLQPAVLSVCRIAGGKLANVIPDEVEFEGTARALDMEVAAQLERGLRETVENVCHVHQVECSIDYQLSYPVTINEPEATELARRAMREAVGAAMCVELPESSMGAEDFAYYLQRYRGVYVKLGTGEDSPALHNSKFDFPDAALSSGIAYLVHFALAALAATK